MNLIPLMDVIFLLLLFFVVSMLHMQQIHNIHLQLPSTVASKSDMQAPLQLILNAEGQWQVNELLLNEEAVMKQVATLYQQYPDRPWLLMADQKADFGLVAERLAELQALGIQELNIATVPK